MAGYGGIINDIGGSLGIGPLSDNRETPAVPNAAQVGRRYTNLLNAYTGSMPTIYNLEAQYQPRYTQLGLQDRQATLDWAGGAGPGIMTAERNFNPEVTNLLDTLGLQASTQLSQNGGLDPAMQRALTQNVRSSQAARGLGYGPGDAAEENYYLTNTMEQRRQANQQFAANIGQLQEQYYKDPFSVAAGVGATAPSASPTIIPSSMSDSMMGTVYNAQAAANIAGANNAAASDNAY